MYVNVIHVHIQMYVNVIHVHIQMYVKCIVHVLYKPGVKVCMSDIRKPELQMKGSADIEEQRLTLLIPVLLLMHTKKS